jgi:hypothetical protein
MSNYTQSTNFATKDALPSGDPLKIVKGTEINTEFVNISVAIATKADLISPTLVTPALGTPSSGVMTNVTGLPLSTGVTGTLPVANGGTGVTASTGTGSVVLSNSPTLVTPALGTPSSGTLTNATGLPIDGGTTGTLPVARGGTGVTSSTGSGSVVLSASPTFTGNVTGTFVGNVTGNVTGSAGTVTTITTTQVLNATAGASVGAVGSYAFLATSQNITAGATVAGSNARFASAKSRVIIGSTIDFDQCGAAPSGTWRLMGDISYTFGYSDISYPSLFLRIS